MTPTYWVEMTLKVSGDRAAVEKLVSALDGCHKGQIAYTFSHKDGQLALAMSTVSDEQIEKVAARVVGTVRATAHELGFHTPGWPEPVTIDDVRIKVLATETVAC
jgi:hypothetical protein